MARKKLTIPGPDDEGESWSETNDKLGFEFLFEFQAMVRELEEMESVVDVEYELGDPVSNFTVETLEHGLGKTVPRFVKRLYSVADGIHLRWNLLEDGEIVPGGGIELFDFATVFDTWLEGLWTTDEALTAEEEDFLWTLRGFDGGVEPGGERMVAVCVEDVDYPTFDLFLHDATSHQSHLVSVDFRTYLQCLLDTRGTYGWVHALAESTGESPAWMRRWSEHFFRRMEAHFPDVELDRFEEG